MDDYKHAIIAKVRQLPLLWDPEQDDYKNKDQRQQAWDKLESELTPPMKGVTAKQTWEGLNRAFNSALSRRKKKSGSGQGSNDKPWKFESSMTFLKAVKEKRNTTSNLEEDRDSSDDETTTSAGKMLEQAMEVSGVYDVVDVDAESSATSTSLKPNPQKSSSRSTVAERKTTEDAHDDGRAGLYRIMTKRLEDKQKSTRLKFFESIMPQVEEMTDDCFLDFLMEVLSSLKRFRQRDAETTRLNNIQRPMVPASWVTSTPSSSYTSSPSPSPSPSPQTTSHVWNSPSKGRIRKWWRTHCVLRFLFTPASSASASRSRAKYSSSDVSISFVRKEGIEGTHAILCDPPCPYSV